MDSTPPPTQEHCPTCRAATTTVVELLERIVADVDLLSDAVVAIGLKLEAEGFFDDEEAFPSDE